MSHLVERLLRLGYYKIVRLELVKDLFKEENLYG